MGKVFLRFCTYYGKPKTGKSGYFQERKCVLIVKSLKKPYFWPNVIDFICAMCYNSVTLRADSGFRPLPKNRR